MSLLTRSRGPRGLVAGGVLVLLLTPAGIARAVTGPEAASRMRAFDAALTGQLTLSMDVTRYRRTAMPEQGLVTVHTVVTTDGSEWAMRQDSRYASDPQYRPLGAPYTAYDYDRDGNLVVWRDTEVLTFVGADVAASRTELTLTRVTPSNRVAGVEAGAPQLLLFSPADAGDFVNQHWPLWAAGRGLADGFDQPRVLSAPPGGAIEIEAAGALGNITGTWRATVDPAAAYLAREASFTPDGSQAPLVVLRTTGTTWFGDIAVPERAEISLDGDRPEAIARVAFTAASAVPDATLLRTAETAIREPYAKDTDVTDYRDRVKGPTSYRVK